MRTFVKSIGQSAENQSAFLVNGQAGRAYLASFCVSNCKVLSMVSPHFWVKENYGFGNIGSSGVENVAQKLRPKNAISAEQCFRHY